MSKKTWKLTSTQIGAIAENIVANKMMIESAGRLSPFSPLADDDGIDLLIYDKKTGKALPVQVKARTGTINKRGKKEKSNIVHFEIRTAALKNETYAFFLAVLLDQDLDNIERAWFIPIKDIRGVMNKRTKHSKYVMRANKNLLSRDKFSPYQCENMSKVCQRILKTLET